MAVTQDVLTVVRRVLVLDISTVWELPGYDSFHVSSHSAWKCAKKTTIKNILNVGGGDPNQTNAGASGRTSTNSTNASVATRQQRRLHFVWNESFSNQTSANLWDFSNLIPERRILTLEGSVSSGGGGGDAVLVRGPSDWWRADKTGRRWQVRSLWLWRYWVFRKVALLSPNCVSILDSVTLSSAQI